MAGLTLTALLLSVTELPPTGDYATGVVLADLYDQDGGGELYRVVLSDDAAEALAAATPPCGVVVELTARPLDLAALTDGKTRGKAYRFRGVAARIK